MIWMYTRLSSVDEVKLTIEGDKGRFRDVRANFSAHPYCARKFTCNVTHQARALSTKMNNDRAGGHCYSFA